MTGGNRAEIKREPAVRHADSLGFPAKLVVLRSLRINNER